MVLTYDVHEDKINAKRSIIAIKEMCKLVDRMETSGESLQKKVLHDKYLCPCGIVNMRIDVTDENGIPGKPYPNRIQLSSERCGI